MLFLGLGSIVFVPIFKVITHLPPYVGMMLSLAVPEEELRKRLIARAQVSGRADDADPAIIQNRIDTYNSSTAPVSAFYKAQGKLKEINGVGSIEEIFERLCVAINA